MWREKLNKRAALIRVNSRTAADNYIYYVLSCIKLESRPNLSSLGVSFNCISDVSYRRPPGLFSVLLDPSVFTLQWSKTIDTEIIDTARSNPWNSPVSQTLFITDNYFIRRRNHQNSKMAKIFDCSKAEWGSESSSTVVRNHSYVKAEL